MTTFTLQYTFQIFRFLSHQQFTDFLIYSPKQAEITPQRLHFGFSRAPQNKQQKEDQLINEKSDKDQNGGDL